MDGEQNQPQMASAGPAPAAAQQGAQPSTQPKAQKSGMAYIGIAVVVLIILIGAAVLLMQKQSGTAPAQQQTPTQNVQSSGGQLSPSQQIAAYGKLSAQSHSFQIGYSLSLPSEGLGISSNSTIHINYYELNNRMVVVEYLTF